VENTYTKKGTHIIARIVTTTLKHMILINPFFL
jgi:hypothetical protein